ncbi:MAG: polysaccharide deacetylase family protein [Terriglobales bacterium]
MLKRLTNLAGSLVVWMADGLSENLCRLFGRPLPKRCVVLAYHSVPADQRALFVQQMEMLLRQAKVVHADIETIPEPGGHYVAITFDDGYDDIVENALPELSKRGMPSTVFIITDLLGCKRNWEHRGGEDTSDVSLMSLEQLRKLPSDLVRIGSHTMTHAYLPKLEPGTQQSELAGSRLKLEKILNQPVKTFALPYGAYNETVLQNCREAGYERVFTGLPVFAFAQAREFLTGRAVIGLTDWPIEFRLKAAGAYRWLPWAYALKRRILATARRKRQDAAPAYS